MKRFIIVFSFALMLLPASLFGQAKNSNYTLPEEPNRAKYIDFPSLNEGLWFAAQFTPGIFTDLGFMAQADLIAGYRFGEFIRAGLGVSPRITGGVFTMPIYADVRGNIISQESRMSVPYWSFDIGYSVGKYYTGIYVSPTVGVRVGMPRNNFIAGVSYILQGVPGYAFHGIALRIGYEF